jgi:hypothetical protein
MHQVVSMPPAIPANGPGVALPTPVPASPPTQGAESAYYHWVRAIRRARATTTFEFTGTAAHLDPARSIVVESLDIEPIAPVQESVLETSNATWFMVTFTVVFLASLAALLLSTEITVAVHRLGQLVAGLVTGPV